ncbi:MAG: hypothetical protein KBA72_17530, partial [Thermoanaerobaculia bacterium]|nr:hypothetical protein [Thermoanaerobaculia bacterium]
MQNFKAILVGLDSTKDARLEIVSGRRPRVIAGTDVRTVSDEIMSDDEVLDLCRSVGAGKALDSLSDQPVTWVATGLPKQIRGSVVQRGRDVAATFSPIVKDVAPAKDVPAKDAAPNSTAALR